MKSLSKFLAVFLIFSVVFFATTERGQSGVGPVIVGCCQYENIQDESLTCEEISPPDQCPGLEGFALIGFTTFALCNEQTGMCSGGPIESRSVPTLSEWGLIALAGVLGIIGFVMVIRNRKAEA